MDIVERIVIKKCCACAHSYTATLSNSGAQNERKKSKQSKDRPDEEDTKVKIQRMKSKVQSVNGKMENVRLGLCVHVFFLTRFCFLLSVIAFFFFQSDGFARFHYSRTYAHFSLYA